MLFKHQDIPTLSSVSLITRKRGLRVSEELVRKTGNQDLLLYKTDHRTGGDLGCFVLMLLSEMAKEAWAQGCDSFQTVLCSKWKQSPAQKEWGEQNCLCCFQPSLLSPLLATWYGRRSTELGAQGLSSRFALICGIISDAVPSAEIPFPPLSNGNIHSASIPEQLGDDEDGC